MKRLRTRHMPLIIGVAAIAAAGCGSSSSSKTSAATTPATPSTPTTSSTGTTAVPSALRTQLAAALKPFVTAGQAVKANPQSVKSPATWTGLANALRESAKNVSAVSGIPASDQAKVKQLTNALNQGATVADKLATDLKNNDQAAFKADLQKWQQIFSQLQSA